MHGIDIAMTELSFITGLIDIEELDMNSGDNAVDISWSHKVFEEGSEIPIIHDKPLKAPYPYTLVGFIDLEPDANWAHPCTYVFRSIGVESYRELSVSRTMPPEEGYGFYE